MCFESVELNFTCFVLHYYWMSKQKGKCCVKILKRLGYKLILKYVLTINSRLFLLRLLDVKNKQRELAIGSNTLLIASMHGDGRGI
jgi:hypothetical protein